MRALLFALVGTLTLLLAAPPARATTWSETQVENPVSGQLLDVQEPRSYGSYIYNWPGKEDQVFWPFTDDAWLWFDPRNGYGAFGADFKTLAGEDLARMKAWLAEHYDAAKPPLTRLDRLRWLERIYGERKDVGAAFWCHFYRLMAFELGKAQPLAGLAYVRKALPLLEQQLRDRQEPGARIVTLYLLGEYHRRLGSLDISRSYFDQAKAAPYGDEDGKVMTGAPYIVQLIAEREALNQDAKSTPPAALPEADAPRPAQEAAEHALRSN
jgi:hypothetical protein